MKRIVLIVVCVCALSLCACGKGKDDNAKNATPSPTASAVTPTAETTPAPTAEPTPSVPAVVLPEGFPELTVNRDAKFTQRELEEKIYNAAHADDRYLFREVITYGEPQEINEVLGTVEKSFQYDAVTKMYDSKYDEDYPAAAVYSLNGETVITKYNTVYGTMAEIGEKRYCNVNYFEKDTAGNIVYEQTYRNFGYRDYNGDGKLLMNAGYTLSSDAEKSGILSVLAMYRYDDRGNQSTYRSYKRKNDTYIAVIDGAYVYEYAEDGNLIRMERTESEKGIIYSHVLETYAVTKDEKGRVASVEVTDHLNPMNSYKLFLFYHEDGSILKIVIRKDAIDEDGNPMESIVGRLSYPTAKTAESLLKGVYLDEYGDDEILVKQGEMKRASKGETEKCFAWTNYLWHDNTYKNGRLVHEINNTKSGLEYRYEYDQKGRVTRKYGKSGVGEIDCRYTYDAEGNLVKEVNTGASCLDNKPAYYLLTEEERMFGGGKKIVETVTYTYDKNGKRTGLERTVTRSGAKIGSEKFSFEEDGYPNHREVVCTEDGKQALKLVGERIAQNESKEK